MAPELVKAQKYDEKVDIWSIGVISYMLLSGRSPFPGRDKKEINFMIVNRTIDLNQIKHFNKVTALGKDFVMKAMERDVSKRYSAEKLLNHPWLITQFEENPLDQETQTSMMENLMKFSKKTKFQKTIISILMGLKADKSDLKVLKQQFYMIDTNNDGTLSVDEFKAASKKLPGFSLGGNKWEQIIQESDLDGNGTIDFQEFYTAAINHSKMVTKDNLLVAF